MTLDPIDNLGFHARYRPEKLAIRDLTHGGSWSYAAFDDTVARCAGMLLARGAIAGARVAALSKNRAELIILHLACSRIGAIFVPLNWRLSAGEIEALMEDAEPALAFTDGVVPSVRGPFEAIDELLDAIARAEPAPAVAIDPDPPALILYTSGTSGRPKGVQLSERNLSASGAASVLLYDVNQDSAVLGDAPMFHTLGIVANVRPYLQAGGTILVSDGFVPERTLDRLTDPALGVTHYFCVPQMATSLRAASNFDPASLRKLTGLFTGGAPNPAEAIKAWIDDGVVLVNGFGMTEAGTIFGMPARRETNPGRLGSVGFASPLMQGRVADLQDRPCPDGTAGELQLKGHGVTSGYWRRPVETADAFTADGWFRTGDIARVDAQGYYWLIDRRKDMFISGGENVYPAEVEAVLAGHPLIAEHAVVGVPDDTWGEVGHLAVVARPGETLDPETVLAAFNGVLARYKHPRRFSQLEALPRNGAGKVLKHELRALLIRDAGAKEK